MSKRQLQRELNGMSKEELIEIILQAYNAGKETKEYFDFFINPDAGGMMAKYNELIAKELSRVKRGRRSKARISVIKSYIKKFISFEPGSDLVTDLYLRTIELALITEKNVYFTETLFNGVKKLSVDLIAYADKHGTAELALQGIDRIMKSETGTKYFRRMIADGVQEGVANIAKLA